MWRADLWGEDRFDTGVWNVAERLVGTSHPGFACGSKPDDLFDRRAAYNNPEHGFAFAPPPTPQQPDAMCVQLDTLEVCPGGRDDNAALCEHTVPMFHDVRDDTAPFIVLPERVRDRFTADRKRRLGQLVPRLPCGERWLIIDLGRPREIIGLRAWFHGYTEVPRSLVIEVEVPAGSGVRRWHPQEQTRSTSVVGYGRRRRQRSGELVHDVRREPSSEAPVRHLLVAPGRHPDISVDRVAVRNRGLRVGLPATSVAPQPLRRLTVFFLSRSVVETDYRT